MIDIFILYLSLFSDNRSLVTLLLLSMASIQGCVSVPVVAKHTTGKSGFSIPSDLATSHHIPSYVPSGSSDEIFLSIRLLGMPILPYRVRCIHVPYMCAWCCEAQSFGGRPLEFVFRKIRRFRHRNFRKRFMVHHCHARKR